MTHPKGVVCPLLTPFDDDGRIARDLWVAHAKRMLEDGAHYLSPFGTTGEATSVGLAARMQALDWLLEGGIPADRLMPGTGVTSVEDTVMLSGHAVRAGCAAVMVLPSFFYGSVGDNGQARYFSDVVEGIGETDTRLILYNIPQNSGVPVSPALAGALAGAAPGTFVAYKDSTGDWDNTSAVIAAAPTMSVFPGTEMLLTRGLAGGAAGCISATVNLNARAIRAVHDAARAGLDVAAPDAGMQRFRQIVQEAGLIGAMKGVMAVTSGDDRWLNLRAPHLDATREEGLALLAALGDLGAHLTPA